jgi:uncharacterized protein YdeI (YjbR/CyaY-like superfamily)
MQIKVDHIHAFNTTAEFANWLAENHSREIEIWLKIQKKSSGFASLSWSEAVVEAIAWGWIDGIKRANDETSWFQRFTPRQPKSNWSRKNREHAEMLTAEGRMKNSGLKTVLSAKADGRWDAAYAGSKTMTFPPSFLAALANNPCAQKAFDSLNRRQRYAIYFRLQNVKKLETRQKLEALSIETLSRAEIFSDKRCIK